MNNINNNITVLCMTVGLSLGIFHQMVEGG